MESAFNQYFTSRLATITSPVAESRPGGDDAAREMVNSGLIAASDAAASSGFFLRSDAQLFLYETFLELAARPIAAVSPNRLRELADALRADMATVTQRAIRNSDAGPTPSDGVSSHQIIGGLWLSWDDLRVAQAAFWGE
jgi:hypothetical protein